MTTNADTSQRASRPAVYDNTNFISKALFCWVNKLVVLGHGNKLKRTDLELPASEEAQKCYRQFLQYWEEERANAKHGTPVSLFRALRRSFWPLVAMAALMKLIWGILILLSAFYFVRELISYAQQREGIQPPPVWWGWLLCALFFVACYFLSMALQQMTAFSTLAGIKIRSALALAIFNKALVIEGIENEVSDVLSLVSNDCDQLLEGVMYMHYLWSGPLESLAIIGLLIYLAGLSALVGLGLILILLPLQFFIAFKMAKFSRKSSLVSEQRIGLLSEVFMAIKLIKLYAWEQPYKTEVNDLRRKELKFMWRGFVIGTFNLLVVFLIPPLLALGIFTTYVLAFGPLSSTVAFTTLSLFNTLRLPLVVLPQAVHAVVESNMALKRIEEFLLRAEMPHLKDRARATILMKDASVFYEKSPEHTVLSNINLFVPKGKLLAILGPVGSGKIGRA